MFRFIILILGIAAIQARVFNNPVLGSDNYPEPGAVKVNNTYYIATTTNVVPQFAIHESTDLINWKSTGNIFDATSVPTWAVKTDEFWAAKIYKIGNNYHVYFNAQDLAGASTGISMGVAIAPHPLGPYTATDRPLLIETGEHNHYPTIANDNGNLYVIWDNMAGAIKGRQLNSNGLSFASDQTTELITANATSWEGSSIIAPWYTRRGDYHYILYTGNTGCETRAIGVARSRNVLGPYEKLADPILKANDDFNMPGFTSLIIDLDGNNDIIVFETQRASANCATGTDFVINMASLGWNADSWPYVYDY